MHNGNGSQDIFEDKFQKEENDNDCKNIRKKKCIYIYGRNKNEGVKNEECKIFYSMIRMTPITSWR